jgi:hypothetical protein
VDLGKLRSVTSTSVLCSRFSIESYDVGHSNNLEYTRPISRPHNILTTLQHNHLILNNGLNSNHNHLPPPRKSQIRLRETRRRPLQLARSLATSLALSRRNKDLLSTARYIFTADESLAIKTPNPTTNIRPHIIINNNRRQTQRLLARPSSPHNAKHDRRLNRTPHNTGRNAALSTLVSPSSPIPT